MPLTGHPIVTRLTGAMKLNAADIGRLAAIFERDLSFRKREELVVQGSEFRNLCFVKDGYAIRYRLLRSGKRQILKLILPGDVIGFPVSFFDRSSYAVVAVSDLTYAACSFDLIRSSLLRAAAVRSGSKLGSLPRKPRLTRNISSIWDDARRLKDWRICCSRSTDACSRSDWRTRRVSTCHFRRKSWLMRWV
ncbi:Crp/Fnr family transcriptional regulator [Mesorhizobium atlanticum]